MRLLATTLFSCFLLGATAAQDAGRMLHRAELMQESNPDSCISLSQKSLTLIKGSQHNLRAYAYWNIAQAGLYQHRYHTALFYANKGRDLFAEHDTSLIYQHLLATTAWTYFDIGNYEQALPYHEQALKTAQIRGDLYSEVLYINAMGLCALSTMHYPKALAHFRKGLLLLGSGKVPYTSLKSVIENNIGIVYSKHEDWHKAEQYFLQSIANSSGKAASLLETYAMLSKVYLQLRMLDECEKYITKADSISYHTNYSFSLIEYFKIRSDYELFLGNFQSAYFFQRKYIELQDKIKNTETQKVTNYLLGMQEEKMQQDELIIQQNRKLNANRRILLLVIILITLFVIITLYYAFRSRSEKMLLRQQILAKELKEKEEEQTELNSKLKHKNELIETLAHTIAERNELVKTLGENVKKCHSNELKSAWRTFEHALRQYQDSNVLSEEFLDDLKCKLQTAFPKLTTKDIQLIIDIRNNLSTKEIAEKHFVEAKSIEMSRYRLRKKLKLAKGIRMRDFIMNL